MMQGGIGYSIGGMMQGSIGKMEGIRQKKRRIPMNLWRVVIALSLNPPGVKEKEYHQIQESPGKTC